MALKDNFVYNLAIGSGFVSVIFKKLFMVFIALKGIVDRRYRRVKWNAEKENNQRQYFTTWILSKEISQGQSKSGCWVAMFFL